MKHSLLQIVLAACVAAGGIANAAAPAQLPMQQHGGSWASGHVQGIAVDLQGGYIYYSFTNLLARYDLQGRLVGTLEGWTGHLGDLDFNPDDGKVYGSLEYKKDQAFYIAMIDVQRIDRVGIQAADSDILRTVYLPEVVSDYTADINGDGRFDGDDGKYRGNETASPDHRYGCSGIDGVAFGPRFGHTDGPQLLTVAYGIYGNTERSDNDHQVLLQYDISDWQTQAKPLIEAAPHHSGPRELEGKYFVRTGNTSYGVQNLSYDASQQRWFMGVYQGRKPTLPNYLLFAVDAAATPRQGDLIGVPGNSPNRWEQGLLLPLADAGLKDPATGIRGWNQKADVGLQAVGDGLFYLATNFKRDGKQGADLQLMRWTGEPEQPFVAP
ncbi:hypothetical protein ABB27_18285 [Stenotrophomonas terrae]|uniref:Phytase-like domain-containing protein n=1 Tax=Stenotrophomonas terrae TaxID=405446 RepID=A0A0R0C864_9GAMM|nr:hypothetical protein [Stenotrophomonas terrae]KRG62311.1 hypothetical protein ABB27_18285 [Stenotrophomonas terrae]